MLQLTGTEAMLIQQEGERQPQHISLLLIYDPSSAPLQQVLYREILAALQRSLPSSRLFRRKLVTALRLQLPYWIEGEHFDFEYHVRHIALPRPGGSAQLQKLLARLHGVPLDLSRPLWEVYVIEGLSGLPEHRETSFALLFKIHLAAVEKLDFPGLIDAIHTTTPEPAATLQPDDWRPEPALPAWRMLSRAYVDGVRQPTRLLRTAGAALDSLRRRATPADTTAAGAAGRTRFNAPLGTERVMGSIDIDQAALSAIAQAVPGVTSDDVIASIVGGALRRYLIEKAELPAESLSAAVPVSVGRNTHGAAARARISLIKLSLGTTIDNPIERLSHIHSAARQAQAGLRAVEARHSPQPGDSDAARNSVFCLHQGALREVLERTPAPFNVLLSRLHCPTAPRYFSGAILQSVVALGTLMDQIGLCHTATSGRDRTSISFVACRDMLPDPERYSACLEQSLRQLQLATLRGRAP